MRREYHNPLANKVRPALINHYQSKPMKQGVAVTLTTNSRYHHSSKTTQSRRDKFDPILRKWHCRLCRHFEGQNFHKKANRHRQQEGIAFPESFYDNPHYHLILDIKEWPILEYEEVAHKIWGKFCESGTVDVQLRYASKWEGYSSKKLHGSNRDLHNNYILIPDIIV